MSTNTVNGNAVLQQKNRFTLKFLYNGKPVMQQGTPMERNFDGWHDDIAPIRMCQSDKTWSDWSDSKEAEKCQKEVADLINHIMWEGSSNFLAEMGANFDYASKFSHILKNKGNKFTLVLVDNMAFKRSMFNNLDEFNELNETLRKLKTSIVGRTGDLSWEQKQIRETEQAIAKFYESKTLFTLNIPADQYTFDGVYHLPPIHKVWKDFNVNYDNVDREDQNKSLRFVNTAVNSQKQLTSIPKDDFQSISWNYRVLKNRANELKVQIDSCDDKVLVVNYEKQLKDCLNKIDQIENTSFQGIRSILKHWLGVKKFTGKWVSNEK